MNTNNNVKLSNIILIKKGGINMKKMQIANELLKNSTNIYIQSFIRKYIENIDVIENNKCEDKALIRLDNCVSYIKEVGFDISNWALVEIPIFYSHCFWNKETRKAFDLAVWDIGEVIPRYLDSEVNEQDAKTIQEAIEKYDTTGYINAGR